jgi:sialate O-acetylesterase
MKKMSIIFFLSLFLVPEMGATIKLPDIIGEGMVLQQNSRVRLWGEARSEAMVTVKTSWSKKMWQTTSRKDGQWSIWIDTSKGSYKSQQIEISDGMPLKLNNVLLGEVWLCSGQSNMEMPLRGYPNSPVANGNEAIATSGQWRGKIHFVSIPWTETLQPQDRCKGKWVEAEPDNAQWFSAIAYHYAIMLNSALDVPIGVISCCWGGSTLEGWLPENILSGYPDIDLDKAKSKKGMQCLRPMIMYNGMLYPLHWYTIKGFLWYQGESNVDKYKVYSQRLVTLIRHWRSLWGLGDIPFYYVEIAPYDYADNLDAARFRESQFQAQFMVPQSGMVCINDLVELYEHPCIHPKNKESVGKRLAYMALSETYHIKGIQCRGPEYQSMEIKDSTAILTFKNADDGFNRLTDIKGFEIAGDDKVFYPAKAEVLFDEHKVKVSSEHVARPASVRYCFHNFMLGNIGNNKEFPMVPFRTDNW